MDEAQDNVDWNEDMDTVDQVLLHWTGASPATFVTELAPGTGTMLVAGGRLFVAQVDGGAPGVGQTNLGYIEPADPRTVLTIRRPRRMPAACGRC